MPKDRFFHEIGLFLKLKKEKSEISKLELISTDPLKFKLTLEVKKQPYFFEVGFPQYFPFQPIIFNSLEDRRISPHQYQDGSMCLKWGIDNWHERITIKSMIENLIELLEIENPKGEEHQASPEGDKFTPAQMARRSHVTIVYNNETFSKFKENGTGFVLIKDNLETRINIGVIHSIDGKKVSKIPKFKIDVPLFYKRVAENITDEEYNKQGTDFLRQKEYQYGIYFLISGNKKIDARFIVRLTREQAEQLSKKTGESIETTMKYGFFSLDVNLIETKSEIEKRINIKQHILKKKIAIVGLGSIGSRVFLDLARAGFDSFVLIDDDIFLPNNTMRHELMLDSFGEYKIDALAAKAKKYINKKINIHNYPFAINGQEGSNYTKEILAEIATSDIVIDCTANSNLIFAINEVVNQHDINYISGSVISGGLGNILIKREKGSKQSILDILESQKMFFSLNKLNRFLTSDYQGTFGEVEYIATMSDCSIIAGLVGKNAINMLKESDVLNNDIYVMSTSNAFLEGSYSCYPVNAHHRQYQGMKLNKQLIKKGKKYYQDYISKTNRKAD